MQFLSESTPDTPQSTGSLESQPREISPEILVSLATVPLLLALLGSKALYKLMREAGRQSEELFRGDRLPLLDFPGSPKSN